MKTEELENFLWDILGDFQTMCVVLCTKKYFAKNRRFFCYFIEVWMYTAWKSSKMSQMNLYFIRETQTQKSLKDKDIRNSIKYKLNIQYENHRSKQSCETISILVLFWWLFRQRKCSLKLEVSGLVVDAVIFIQNLSCVLQFEITNSICIMQLLLKYWLKVRFFKQLTSCRHGGRSSRLN